MDKLVKFQKEIKVAKAKFNIQGEFKFRSLENILEVLKPIIHPEGFTVSFREQIEEMNGSVFIESEAIITDGYRRYTATSIVEKDSEQKGLSKPQLSGAAISYARKYALQGLLALDDGVDSDEISDNTPKEKKIKMVKNSPAWKKAVKYAKDNKGDISSLRVKYEITAAQEQAIKREANG